MSSKQRTLSGLIVGDFDELTVEDDFSLLGALDRCVPPCIALRYHLSLSRFGYSSTRMQPTTVPVHVTIRFFDCLRVRVWSLIIPAEYSIPYSYSMPGFCGRDTEHKAL